MGTTCHCARRRQHEQRSVEDFWTGHWEVGDPRFLGPDRLSGPANQKPYNDDLLSAETVSPPPEVVLAPPEAVALSEAIPAHPDAANLPYRSVILPGIHQSALANGHQPEIRRMDNM